MAQQQKSGKPWSGANPIPNIKQFVEGLDKDKASRDRQIDSRDQAQLETVTDHKNEPSSQGKKGKVVTDPTTGNDVVIENVGRDFMKSVKDPQLSVTNANLGKPTTAQSHASQKNPEYKEQQDITAPPDPVEPGVCNQICGNLFHHTNPSLVDQ